MGQPINSVMKLLLPMNVPLDLDPKFRGYVEELTNAIQQLQNYIEQFAGFTQKIQSSWSQLQPTDTLLEHQVNRFYVKATEAIALGAVVNVYSAAGIPAVRNANAADNTKPAIGFCTTLGGIASGAYGEVILLRGLCVNISGLTAGTRYFLSTTNGLVQAGEPAAAGNIGQYIGYALTASLLLIDINMQFNQH